MKIKTETDWEDYGWSTPDRNLVKESFLTNVETGPDSAETEVSFDDGQKPLQGILKRHTTETIWL